MGIWPLFCLFLSSTQCPLTSWSHWKLLFSWSVHSHSLALLSCNIYQDRLQNSCLLSSPLFTYLREDLKCYKPPSCEGWTCTYAFLYCWITDVLLFTPVSTNYSLTLKKHLSLQTIAEVLHPSSLFCALPQCHLMSWGWMCIVFLTSLVSNWRCRKRTEVRSGGNKSFFHKNATEMTERTHRHLHCAFQMGQLSSIKVLTFIVQAAKLLLPKLWDLFYFHTDLSLERQQPWEAIT